MDLALEVREHSEMMADLLVSFNEQFEENGNEYLYPIQAAGEAKEKIGGGNLYHALLVLISSIREHHGEEVWRAASNCLKPVLMDESDFEADVAIGSTILRRVPNEEDLETLINNDRDLIAEIIEAAGEYEAEELVEHRG